MTVTSPAAIDPSLDAHAKPPQGLRDVYKRYQKMPSKALDSDPNVFDMKNGHTAGFLEAEYARTILELPRDMREVITRFLESAPCSHESNDNQFDHEMHVFEHPDAPGLFIFPNIIPSSVQIALLNKLFHRDLSNPAHLTNLHLFHNIPYPTTSNGDRTSFFSPAAQDVKFTPLDPSVHKPFNITQVMNRKLRWLTLGGQYDWTAKAYPSTAPPPFPPDIAGLIEGLFPAMKAQAAIFNLYSPGDTLSLHRDVSEECHRPLVSLSLGCDGVFVVGLGEAEGKEAEEARAVTVRLGSGDVVVMSGEARTAWHSVPQVVAGTCPQWMEDWPCMSDESEYANWKGWMKSKRINLNVRQMWDS